MGINLFKKIDEFFWDKAVSYISKDNEVKKLEDIEKVFGDKYKNIEDEHSLKLNILREHCDNYNVPFPEELLVKVAFPVSVLLAK